jgi:hypothetical protein
VGFNGSVRGVEGEGKGHTSEKGDEGRVVADGSAFVCCQAKLVEDSWEVFVLVVEGDVYLDFTGEGAVFDEKGVGRIAIGA